ncbi:AlpA family transcriptional regulator [Arcobacter sp. F2176]|uniref:helix-turn-helix transcriptional regulator n=1 Tax=Arcobacter sp. F2176 TaxID=2044511 RepID=UPI00100A81F8|nr:AlpA family phage regulatory protein [Arcobacter sp. F2176]RXJ79519.1 AlpA family transcriptional regulator [Arcobacter sp. F2176]
MTKFIRIQEVMKKTGIARSTLWLWVNEKKFPQPIKLSPRITVWEEEKIENWMKEKL